MARSQLILDRYRIVGQAGAGGYGTVVHAFDTHLKRDVAIKCIELSEDEVARARLVALEARMAADLEDAEELEPGAPAGVVSAGSTAAGASAASAASGVSAGSGSAPVGGVAPGPFPADPDFLRGVDERRAGRRSAAAVAAADEVPPWEDAPAPVGAPEPSASLAPWDVETAARAGVARPSLGGRPAPRKTRHAPEPSRPFVEVQDAAPMSDYVDESAVDVRHLRGIRASRTIDGSSERRRPPPPTSMSPMTPTCSSTYRAWKRPAR